MLNRCLRSRIWAVLGLCVIIAAPISSMAETQSISRGLWNRKSNISAKMRQIRSKLKFVRKQQKNVTCQLYNTQHRIRETRKNITCTETKLNYCESRLKTTRERLQATRQKLARQNALLSRRLADIYTGEQITYLNILLDSADFWTLVSRVYYLEQVVAADVKLIEDIRNTKRELEHQEALVLERKREISRLHRELKYQQMQHYELVEEQQSELKKILKDARLYEQALAELERESKSIEALIRSMQRTASGAKRYARMFIGGLSWPLSGQISSGFGYRIHPILRRMKFHTGIDITAPSGTPIRSAADGEVIVAGWRRGYGNTVVIDHGGGVSTLYGHCAIIECGVGQQVKRGQVIATVGSTGFSTGPHLHFERRENGQPVNPF